MKITKKIPYFIAEAGVNHNGSIELAKKLIDLAASAGADAVKFQSFKAEDIVTKKAKKAKYQGEGTQLELLKKLEMTEKDFVELKEYCDSKGIVFSSTPHTIESVDYLERLVPFYKIASGDINNLPLLKKIASKEKPIIISTGMATLEEAKKAEDFLIQSGAKNITFLHCTTAYPCPRNEVNLRAMANMEKELKSKVGYSDHTEGIDVSLMAASLGATVIEKHFTLDKELEGPDHKAALSPKELKELVKKLKSKEFIGATEEILGRGIKEPTESEKEIVLVARKSLISKRKIEKGKKIGPEDLAIKRPATGISPSNYFKILGRIARRDIQEEELIREEWLEEEKNMSSEKVLVTGGLGFIGSHLCEALLKEGYDIVILDDYSTGKEENVSSIKNKVKIIKGKVEDYETVYRSAKDCDYILHLAYPYGKVGMGLEEQYIEDGIVGTFNVLKAGVKRGVKKVVNASSVSAYGILDSKKVLEDERGEQFLPYGVTKLSGELYCKAFSKLYGIDTVSLRYFFVYGPRYASLDHSAMVKFLNRGLKSETLLIYGDGEQIRDYSYVSDVVRGTILAMKAKNSKGRVYNISSGEPTSINTLAKKICKIIGNGKIRKAKKGEYQFSDNYCKIPIGVTTSKGDTWIDKRNYSGDLSKAKKELGYSPKVSLEEGIQKTLKWLKEKSRE